MADIKQPHPGSYMIYSILIAAGEDGVLVEPNQARVEASVRLGMDFQNSVERSMTKDGIRIRLRKSLIEAVDKELAGKLDEANQLTDSLIALPKSRIITP